MKRLRSDRIRSAAEDGEVEMDVSCVDWELSKNKALFAGADCARSRGGRGLGVLMERPGMVNAMAA